MAISARRTDSTAGPKARYAGLLADGLLQADAAQARVIDLLEDRFQTLERSPPRWRQRFGRSAKLRGLYLHGGVGRGKSLLMNLFAAALDSAQVPVRRIHFHRFMDEIHTALRELDGQRDPLRQLARDLARHARVLCLDEFHVADIGDAMILAELLDALFACHVLLVTTSNTAPEELYADGLQRARFLPAIELLQRHCEVVELRSAQDYRLRELTRHACYYTTANDQASGELDATFAALVHGETVTTAPIRIRARDLQPVKRAGSVAWFGFDVLCEGPRATADYIELARRFGTLIVSGVPVMDDAHNDAARRFVHFVDECYDRDVKLMVAAAAPPGALYLGQRLAAAFQRTVSRLIEMQSHAYLARPHRP